MEDFKDRLLNFCSQKIGENIRTLKEELGAIKSSMESETKSSVGDKHETARARMQAEEETLRKRLQEHEEMLAHLQRADKKLIVTTTTWFLLAVPLGKQEFESQEVFVISPQSPVGKALRHSRIGQTVTFNQQQYQIVNVH